MGGLQLIFCKLWSKELNICNIFRANELKFGSDLGCRVKVLQISDKILSQELKWWSNELNHAAIEDLKNGGGGVKRGS